MALILTDYLEYATVRGLLGVAETEIPDEAFAETASVALLEVTLTLEELNETIPTLFETIKNIVVGSRTALQTRFYNLVQVYAAYVVAEKIASGSIELYAPQRIEDGKASAVRKEDAFAALRGALLASLATWRTRLSRTLTLLDPAQSIAAAATQRTVSSVGLAVDPITGA